MQSFDLQANGFDLVAHEPPRTLDIEIDPPLVLNEKTYDVMSLKEPTGFQVAEAEKYLSASPTAYQVRQYQFKLISGVTGIPEPLVPRIAITKLNEAFAFLQPYTGIGPSTGAT